jgi:N utilization substance protein A
VIVPSDQMSLAIGKGGQNARLAVKLTGWNIDIEGEDGTTEGEVIDDMQADEAAKELEAEEGNNLENALDSAMNDSDEGAGNEDEILNSADTMKKVNKG